MHNKDKTHGPQEDKKSGCKVTQLLVLTFLEEQRNSYVYTSSELLIIIKKYQCDPKVTL